jgi:hypothetical protein
MDNYPPGAQGSLVKNETDDFNAWSKKVDDILVRNFGLGILDLPDLDYYSFWSDGISPGRMAKMAVRCCLE